MAFNVGITVTARNNTDRALKSTEKNLDKVGKTATKTTKALKGLRLALSLIAVGTLVRLGKSIFDVVGKMQLMLIRLSNVEGGAAKAKVTFDKLFKTFGSSPFAIDAVTDSFIRLKAAGVEGGLAFRAVEAGADAIAAFGGTSEELKRFSIGLQQVAGKGVLSMEELRQQIGEALPVAMRVFASQTGRSISEVISEVEKGRISSTEFISELTIGLEKSFGGFSAKLGDTLLGSVQGLKSKVQKVFAGDLFGDDVAVRLTAIIQNVGDEFVKFVKSLTAEDVDTFFEALRRGANIAVGVGKVIAKVAELIFKFLKFLTDAASSGALETAGGLGIIGLVLFGPLGFAAGIGLGLAGAGKGADEIMKKLNAPIDPGENTLANRLLAFSIFEEGSMQEQFDRAKEKFVNFQNQIKAEAAKKKVSENTLGDNIFGFNEEQIKRIGKSLEDVKNPTKELAPLVQGLGKMSQQAKKQLEGLAKSTAAALSGKETFPFVKTAETALNRMNSIIEGFEGDRKLRDKLANLVNPTDDEKAQLAGLNRGLERMDALITVVRGNIEKAKGIGFDKQLIKSNDAAAGVLDKFRKLVGGSSAIEQKVSDITEKFRDIKVELEKQLADQEALALLGNEQVGEANRLREALAAINTEREIALDHAREQARIDAEILGINSKLTIMRTQQQIVDLKKSTRGGAEILLGSDSGDAAADRRAELNRQMEQTKIRILQTQKEINQALADGEPISNLEEQEVALERLAEAQQAAFEATTAAGMAAQEMWLSVRDTMTRAAEEGLKSLIDGTKSFKEITRDAFNSITEAAIKYLIELVRIKIQTIAINALSQGGGGGGGGGQAFASAIGSFFASKNGNAVKKFANGGIANQIGNVVQGPSMFGIAGEAGPEGILPLENVGGKLGVNAKGGGGGDMHVHITAMDTQSAMQVLVQNKDGIVNMLRNEGQLNNAPGKSR